MEVQTPFFADSARTLDPKYTSTRRLFTIMVVVIFLAEIVAMTVIYYTKIGPYWAETLLDATIMVILTLPMIYYLHFRVLVRHIADKNRSEALLTRVLENLPVGVWITDKNGRLLHGNPASQAIWAGAATLICRSMESTKPGGWIAASASRWMSGLPPAPFSPGRAR